MRSYFAGVLAAAVLALVTVGVPLYAQKKPAVDAARLYQERCAMCHGEAGDALIPNQNFVDGQWQHGSSMKEVAEVIRSGVPGTMMTPFKDLLTAAETEALARYVRHLDPKLKAQDARRGGRASGRPRPGGSR